MTITEFLEARITEDEFGANREILWGTTPTLTKMNARVLAECAAKRAIIGEHVPVDYSGLGMASPNACLLCGKEHYMDGWEWEDDSFPCPTLRTLAAVYKDHADYRQDWAL